MFNADAILNQTVEKANETKIVPIPEGEYSAFIEKLDIRQAKDTVVCDIYWKIDNPTLEEELGRELNVKQGLFLDITDGGALDFGQGKNVNLGRLREALSMNNDGQAWNFGMLEGHQAYVSIAHKPNKDGTDVFANVKSVASQPSAQ